MRRMLAMLVLVSLFWGFTVVAGANGLPPGGTFVDDDGNIHEGNIEAIAAAGITKGCNPPVNDRYCPADRVTRGQMAAFLRRAFSLPSTSADFFTDDSGSVFQADINALAAAGITKGCNPPANDQFCPHGHVTRGQMAAFLRRAFAYPTVPDDFFVDDNSSIFQADINAIAARGVTKGCNPPDDNRYCPDAFVLRDQMASFLARALKLAPIAPPPDTTTTTTTPPATNVSWNCDFSSSIYSDIYCYGNTDLRTPGDEWWSCEEGVTWSCGGEVDTGNSDLDIWVCSEIDPDIYWCFGEVDNRTPDEEDWLCALGSDFWTCTGNIDRSDAANESWTCELGSYPDWVCTGDIDKGRVGAETLSCDIGGPVGRAWECWGSATWLAPVVANPDFFFGWTLSAANLNDQQTPLDTVSR